MYINIYNVLGNGKLVPLVIVLLALFAPVASAAAAPYPASGVERYVVVAIHASASQNGYYETTYFLFDITNTSRVLVIVSKYEDMSYIDGYDRGVHYQDILVDGSVVYSDYYGISTNVYFELTFSNGYFNREFDVKYKTSTGVGVEVKFKLVNFSVSNNIANISVVFTYVPYTSQYYFYTDVGIAVINNGVYQIVSATGTYTYAGAVRTANWTFQADEIACDNSSIVFAWARGDTAFNNVNQELYVLLELDKPILYEPPPPPPPPITAPPIGDYNVEYDSYGWIGYYIVPLIIFAVGMILSMMYGAWGLLSVVPALVYAARMHVSPLWLSIAVVALLLIVIYKEGR